MLLMIALLAATYTDLKNRMIPVWLFPQTLLVYLFLIRPDRYHLLGLTIGIPVLFLCFIGKMGGGDLLMFLCVGYVIGICRLVYFAFCMSFVGALFFFIRKRKTDMIPLAPLVTGAYSLYLMF